MQNIKKSLSRLYTFKVVIFSLVVSLAILLTGCNNNEPKILDNPRFHSGYDGLDLKFIKGMPPDEIWENTDFSIGLEVRNKGAWDINNPVIAISGFSKDYFTIQLDSPNEDIPADFPNKDSQLLKHYNKIEGKDFPTPEGGLRIVTWSVKNNGIPYGDYYDTAFLVTGCYGYKTEAGADICIDPYVNQPLELQKKGCTMKEISIPGGSGSPVAVTRIVPEVLVRIEKDKEGQVRKNKLQLLIYIDNKGNGEIVNHKTVNKECAPTFGAEGRDQFAFGAAIDQNHFNIVEVSASLSNKEINCNVKQVPQYNVAGKPLATLYKYGDAGENVIVCQTDISDINTPYLAPLVVYLKYGYITKHTKTVKIKKLFTRFSEDAQKKTR